MLGTLRQHLVEKGHSDAEIDRLLQSEPFETANYAVPEIMKLAVTHLKGVGHECAGIMYPMPYRFKWCGRTDTRCEELDIQEEMEAENERVMHEMRQLAQAGHRCLEIQESFPAQLVWCRQAVCLETCELMNVKDL